MAFYTYNAGPSTSVKHPINDADTVVNEALIENGNAVLREYLEGSDDHFRLV